jgi:anti-sigma factor RsiW
MTYHGFKGIRRWLKGSMLKRMHRMITCKEFEDFVQRYLDGGLTDLQRSLFERHMRVCRECREYLAAYQRTMELGRAVLPSSDEPVPDDVPEDLIRAIIDARKQ